MSDLRIAAIRLVCRDVASSAQFFQDAFGCHPVAAAKPDMAGGMVIGLGAQRLHLVPTTAEAEDIRRAEEAGTEAPSNASSFQHCAIIVSRMGDAMAQLERTSGWTAISEAGPERLPAASGGATAFKFRDPDGHPLEFLEFPAGAVPDHLREAEASNPCLGIDHSAITVADVDRAITFYEGLGFRVAGRQCNEGAEQGRMDGLGSFARCEVVTLRLPGDPAPHLELLGYREPRVIMKEVADDSPFATTLLLARSERPAESLRDPDGHRLEFRREPAVS
ncbi:MAG: VOC family protein [Fulvimarina manganoxydans]|uniref:VOC family protein n=1 Tax=Fulvimarina manganoxydans TaxID=937218 RepID=UPI0023551BE9|nr:VOC family protein [Fulvimarina manganoxydans]MCK5930864.1 VOC family protein [Fulvimarina manganoxydans]